MEPSIYRMRLCDLLALCVMTLLGLGIIMVQSASMNVGIHWQAKGTNALGQSVDQVVECASKEGAEKWARLNKVTLSLVEPVQPKWYWTDRGTRHVMYALAALATFFVVGRIDYSWLAKETRFRNPAVWGVGIGVLICAAVLVPGIGTAVNGARRWIRLGPVQLQPSELGKWAVVIFLAWFLAYRPNRARKLLGGFLPMMIGIGAICLLIVIQDFGTAALIALCALLLMMAGRVKLWHLAMVIPPAMSAAYWFVRHKEYRWRRMTAFVDPFAAPQKEGYHMIQSLLSFATGGIFGKGLGNGIQKLGYLPEDTTDFIYAVICEELGLFGALFTIILYVGILYVAWQVVKQTRDNFGRLLAFGVAAMTGLQALINIAVATVSVPTKGLSLPLVSAGGTGLIITCAALGLLYSVCRHEHSAVSEDKAIETASWQLSSTALQGAL